MLKNIVCSEKYTLRKALKIIDKNAMGVCFVVNTSNKLRGILTDGDIRRALLNNADLDSNVIDHMNKKFLSLPISSDIEEVNKYLQKKKYKVIPLCNNQGEVVDFADRDHLRSIPILSPSLNGNELNYLNDCITTNWISSKGKYVSKFENIFEVLHPNYYALAVSNGTTALHLALVALGIKEGDEVIIPDSTFAATINAVLYCNATPVICEINNETWCIDENEIKSLITSKTKAIIPVHLYGLPANMKEIMKIANNSNLFVLEDCAEAIGSKIDDKRVGTFGDCSTFSFYGNKTITTGEGGMVLFKNKKHFELGKLLRDHGMSNNKRYWHEIVGFNYRMTNLQAAVGVAQMERFEEIINKKREIFNFYNINLLNLKGISKMPFNSNNLYNSSWLYTLILDSSINRDKLIHKLNQLGIELRPSFCSLSEMPPYKNFRKSLNLKNSYLLSRNGVSLPSSIMLNKIQLKFIVQSFADVLKNNLL
jgi:perosamine synthetase